METAKCGLLVGHGGVSSLAILEKLWPLCSKGPVLFGFTKVPGN
jgi:hypothetical protein